MRISAILITIFLLGFSVAVRAQKRGVIISMADGIPVRDVKIYTNTNHIDTTNWRGEFSIKSYFTSVTIVHPDYVSRTMNLYEMSDTIELLPKFHTLDEVVVYGRAPRVNFKVNGSLGDIGDFMKKPTGMDFLSIFYRKHGLTKKQREKHDEIIKNY